MSTWFDRLLEELQRRQEEADARREGRPLPPRQPRAPRDVTPPDSDREPGSERDWRPPWERRTNGDGPTDGRGRGRGIPPIAGGTPWRRWVVLGGLFFAALFVLGLVGGVVNLVTDLMWYDALGRRDVLTTRLSAQVGLFVVGLLVFLGPALLSIWIASRIAPRAPVRPLGALDMPNASRVITWGLAAAALLLALFSGFAWSGSWETILLFANGAEWGRVDETLGRDIGYYVFGLPFLRFVQSWAITVLIVIGLLTLGAYAAGALRWSFRLTAPVRAHLSIIGALLLVAFAAGYQLDISELAYSTRGIEGSMQAAAYTDVNAQLPASVILTVVALGAAALLVLNTWFRTLWLLLLAGGAWLLLSLLVGGLYPTFVQSFVVNPNEQNLERPYIRNHIAATRAAFDLDAIETRRFTGEQEITREVAGGDQATIDNLRLWDYRPLLTTLGQQQILRRYYEFRDVDIDRYLIGDGQRQIMLSGRELNIELLADAARTWTNERLVFTHGYGITAVPVDGITPQGQPDYLVSGINRDPQLPVSEPRIYFGEATDTYVVTGTTTPEFDFPLGEEGGETTSWSGTTGIGIGNPIARLLFAMRFGDLNLLISNQLTEASQILMDRALHERVEKIAPFLAFDRDPYLVSADDRLLWVWDAYTITDRYPNAQPLPPGSRFGGANYMRNSVKVVVDAYDGTVHFYAAEPDEPILAAYARIFPGLFEPLDAMSDELRAHLRYPEDLFTAQNTSFTLYHLPATDAGATTFYNQDDRWAFPREVETAEGRIPTEPYYVIMRIPGEEAAEFVLIQPLVPEGRDNMIAWVAARMDPGSYGERIAFRFPSDTTTLGPAQVAARINQDETISAQFSLWSRAGSSVIEGNLLVLPIGEDALLYVEPVFLQAEAARFPEFVRVIMVAQDRIAFAETVDEALRQLFGEAPLPPPEEEPPGEEPPGEPGELPADVPGLIAEARRLYTEAQDALDEGDLGTYQRRIDELAEVLDALFELAGPSPTP